MSMSAVGWVFFGFAIWAACIFLKALQNRFAPEMNQDCDLHDDDMAFRGERESRAGGVGSGLGSGSGTDSEKDREIEALRKRVETLEAIVTDRKYQWEAELNRSGGSGAT